MNSMHSVMFFAIFNNGKDVPNIKFTNASHSNVYNHDILPDIYTRS